MDRYYILTQNEAGEPFVLAETPDYAWARDEILTWRGGAVLSEEEALIDPDFRDAVLRWKAGDDGAFQTELDILAADTAMDDAMLEAKRAGDLDEEALREMLFPSPTKSEDAPTSMTEEQAVYRQVNWDMLRTWFSHDEELKALGLQASAARRQAKEMAMLATEYERDRTAGPVD